MYLESGRDLFRGAMVLLSVAIAHWLSLTAGLVLAAFVGLMILQSVITDWCPADLLLRPLGLKKKLETRE
ncbi:MAG TPA: YgaP-like transmembrane domain [Anaerolineales bacterium]|nr:YgaP-like transmembrane domain [Anaerolineales bacterium]